MKEKRISFGQGKGSLTHNNRDFVANNVDVSRIADNVTFIRQPIAEAYEQLFGEATERYNAKQKRSDRKISNYYEHTFGCKPCNTVKVNSVKQKSFYEDVVQIGKMEDSGYGTEDFQLVADCLKEYMEGFQKRNPNFYVFNAVLHMDEATPHLHIDYIPVGHYKRGQDTQNGIAQALKEMGFGTGEFAIARWRASEVEVLNKICREHGIEPLPPEKARGTVEVAEYKEQRQKADELAVQNAQAQAELDAADKLIEMKSAELSSVEDKVRSAESTLADTEQKISDTESELSDLSERIKDENKKFEAAKKNANAILNFIPNFEKDDKAMKDFELAQTALGGYTRSTMVIMRSKDEIKAQIDVLCRILKTALNKVHKYGLTIAELRQSLDNSLTANQELSDDKKSLSARNRELSNDYSSLKKEHDAIMRIYQQIQRVAPEAVAQAKQLVEMQKQMEQQQYTQPTKKKKSWGMGL